MSAVADELDECAALAIDRAGFLVAKVYRHYPPYDTDRPAIVLFTGRRAITDPVSPYTAEIDDEDPPRVRVHSGW